MIYKFIYSGSSTTKVTYFLANDGIAQSNLEKIFGYVKQKIRESSNDHPIVKCISGHYKLEGNYLEIIFIVGDWDIYAHCVLTKIKFECIEFANLIGIDLDFAIFSERDIHSDDDFNNWKLLNFYTPNIKNSKE